MMKRLVVMAMLASSLAAPTLTVAEAGPLREKIKHALTIAKQDVRGVARFGEMRVKCILKGKGGFIC